MNKHTESTNKRIYLASPFFDEEQIQRVIRVEEALEANSTVLEYFSPRKNQLDTYEFGTKEWRTSVFNNDVSHINWCDVVVAVIDFQGEHVDSGTAWELGYAYSIGKPIVILHEKNTELNLMVSDSLHAYFKEANSLRDYDFIAMPKNTYDGQVI